MAARRGARHQTGQHESSRPRADRYRDPPVDVCLCTTAIRSRLSRPATALSRAGARDLFTVVFEQVMNDTALYADVVLPRRRFSKGTISPKLRPDPHGSGAAGYRRCRRSRSNADVFGELASRLGFSKRRSRRTSSTCSCTSSMRCRQQSATPARRAAAGGACGPAPIQFVDVFPNTPDRKVDLFPAALESSARPLSLPAGSGHRAVPAHAHLTGERAHDQLDARPAAAARRQTVDASGGRGRARAG